MEFSHVSVMLEETIEALNIKPGGIYLDGTVGGGGHSLKIAERLNENGRLICLDQDEEAIKASSERLKDFTDRVRIIRSNFVNFRSVLDSLNIDRVDGILLDLGVSSHQFDDAERGFSYREDAPLDMRMDQRNPVTARDIVNNCSEAEIYRIIRDYGEDPFAKNIARHIVKAREKEPIETTFQLVSVIKEAIPARIREKGGHPARQTFQALRIQVNQELQVLEDSLNQMVDSLQDNGRIAIITFHSLEDRIVKKTFRTLENPCTCPPDFPVCVCGKKPLGKTVTRKPVSASKEELEVNPRSRSAHLRVFERHYS